MDLATAERLASIADPKAVAALEGRRSDPAVAKAVAEQFGTLLLQRVLQSGDGEPLAMTGGTGGTVVNALFADTIAQTAMSGDRLGLADLLFRSLAATRTPAAGTGPGPAVPVAAQAPATSPSAAAPSPGGLPLSPYWRAGGMRPLAGGPATIPTALSGGTATGGAAITPGSAAGMPPPSDGAPPVEEAAAADPGSGYGAQITAFARRLGPALQQAAAQLGVSPRILLAQAALESGWGRSMVGNNVFGIKADPASARTQISAPTQEIEHGRWVSERASFRAYGGIGAAVQDYVALITGSSRYHQAVGLGDDARAYGEALVRGGYATDSAYAEKLAAVAASPSLASAMAALNQADRPQPAGSEG